MIWYTVKPPGTPMGPCADNCDHRECESARALARAPCGVCGEAIGYDRPIFFSRQMRSAEAGGVRTMEMRLDASHRSCKLPLLRATVKG